MFLHTKYVFSDSCIAVNMFCVTVILQIIFYLCPAYTFFLVRLGLRKSSIISNKQKCVLDMNKIFTRPPCLTYVTAPVYGRFRMIAFQGKLSTVVYWVHWESSIYLSITWADDIFLQKPSSQYEIYSQRQSSLRHCKQTVYAICLD